MLSERRYYSRFDANNRDILLFSDGKEYFGNIIDVSECGLGVTIKDEISLSDKVDYQFIYTSNNPDGHQKFHIVNGIGHIARTGDNFIAFKTNHNDELSLFVRTLICNNYSQAMAN